MMGALVRRVALLALVLLGPATAGGEDTWILDATSWERGKNLLPEPVLKRVQAGEYRFPVVPADPARFHGVELELASELMTMTAVAEVLSRAWGVELTAPDMTAEEAIAAGAPAFAVRHEWQNEVGQPARPEFARALGIPLTSFADWAATHLTAL